MVQILLALVLLLSVTASDARKLYKYQDDNGNWIYTDKAPKKEVVNLKTERLKVTRQSQKVQLRRRGSGDDAIFYIINDYDGPIEFELSLVKNLNIVANPPLPKGFIVPANSELRAVHIAPKRPRYNWSYKAQYRYMLGDPAAKHQPDKPYRAPFALQTSYPISQGFFGPNTHTTVDNLHAVDIAMPENTAIHAARTGTVMDVTNDFYGSGFQEKYKFRANHIRILHQDGTMAVYAHLSLDSAQVSTGMQVQEGQLLAYSGNTGYSSGPHLHFVIQRNAGQKLVSVPFKFADQAGHGVTPDAGTWLTAYE